MSEGGPRVRFAPSPTGSLHVGNARTALFNWLAGRSSGGTVILRIEDTDIERHEEGSEEGILRDLRWLGLDWDEGPDTGGPRGPYRQSERLPLYRREAERLLRAGRAYPCFCTEEELKSEREARRAAGLAPRYSGRCAGLGPAEARRRVRAGEPHVVRFRVAGPEAAPDGEVVFEDRIHGTVRVALRELSDPVLLRRDGRPTYNFAVVVDDAAMGVDLVIRGDDHLSNTPRQVLLYKALGHPLPALAHLPTVRGSDGRRLSKRHGAVSVAEYRERGYPAPALLNALALLGWSPPDGRAVLTVREMVEQFDLGAVSRSPALFDPAKLDWISARHIRALPVEDLARETAARLASAGFLPEPIPESAGAWIRGVAEMVRDSLDRFDQVPDRCAPLFRAGPGPEDAPARQAIEEEGAARVLQAFLSLGPEAVAEDRDRWRELAARIRRRTGARGRALFRPIRAALTGAVSGPELDHLVPLIVVGDRLFPDHVPSLERRIRRALEFAR